MEHSTSKLTEKTECEMNRFLFSVVNQFTLDEFKKYTNFRELMRNALEKHDTSRLDSVEQYIELNFKQNLPFERVWKKGAFACLILTSDFYESETSERVFHQVFGIKKCTVIAGQSMDVNKAAVDVFNAKDIDLTIDEHHDSNEFSSKHVLTCLSEPSQTSLINDDVQPSEPKIGPKSQVKRHSLSQHFPQILSNNQPWTCIPKTSQPSLRSDNVKLSKSKIEPKSEVKRDSSSYNLPKFLADNQLSTCIPTSSIQCDGVQPPKSPKSRVKQDTLAVLSENCPCNAVSTSPIKLLKDIHESQSVNNLMRSFCTELSYIEKQFEKYLATADPSKLSLKQFWLDFLIQKYNIAESSNESNSKMSPTMSNSNISMRTYNIEIKQEKICEESNQNDLSLSDIEIDISNFAIKITNDCSQDLVSDDRVNHDEQLGFVGTFTLPQYCSELAISSVSKGCSNNEKPLNIAMESPKNMSAVSDDDVEMPTVTESKIQRQTIQQSEVTARSSSSENNRKIDLPGNNRV